jgi:hypothetical protein
LQILGSEISDMRRAMDELFHGKPHVA